MLQVYNKYGQIKVVSSTSSSGVSSVSGVSPITSTGGSNPIISTLVTPNKLLGRYSPSTGPMQEILIGTGLSLVGNTLNSTSVVTANALTRVNDTNVTLTLGGTPATALLQNVSLTLGWTGTLADSRIASASVWNAKQDALNGTGFVKSTAGVISYDTSIYTPTSRTLTINGTTYDLSADRSWTIATSSGTVTSVGITVPIAFNVTPSTITTAGTFAITATGTASQYIRGDGQLATLPTASSGGSSISYYLNGGTSQGTILGSTYYQMSKIPVLGTGVNFSLAGNGLITQWITDALDPNRLEIPAGNWNFETYLNASSIGGTPAYYIELLKYDGSTFTSIANNSGTPESITNGTAIDVYLTSLAIPQTTLLVTDRLALRYYIVNSVGGRTITMHTQDSHLCQVITNFSGGVTSLNGLTANTQNLAVGTSGTDFNISSATDTHTFNLPDASATARGVITTGTQTIAGSKTFTSYPTIPANGGNSGQGAIIIDNGSGLLQVAYNGVYPNLTEIANIKGVTSPIQTQIDAVNVNVITITTAVSIDTDTTSGAYGQHGRHNKISNGANAINIQCVSTSNADFVASYEKIGSGTITFTAGAGITLTTLSGTAAMTGVAGSKACLSRNGSIYYLQITNY